MKITNLILKNYNRLFLNNIKTLELTPTRKINLIIGTNGSGKSSLIKEMSPLPFDKNDFNSGYKEIHIECNNKKYVLIQNDGKFNFIEDRKELNISGNRKVQLSLIKSKFNYDVEFHKLFTNVKNFTDMTSADRKAWLIKLSIIDYDYSLAYFKRLLSRDRDIRGTIKVMSNKLVEEQTNLLQDEVKEKYKEDLNVLNQVIDSLLVSINNNSENNKQIDIDTIIDTNDKLFSKILTSIPYSMIDSEIKEKEISIKETMFRIKSNLDLLDKYKNLKNKNITNIDNLYLRKKELSQKLLVLDSKIPEYLNRSFIKSTVNALQAIREPLGTVLSSISLSNINLTIEEHTELDRDIYKLEENIKLFKNKIEKYKLELEISITKKEEEVTCTSCNTKFNPYYSKTKEEELIDNINKYALKLKEADSILKDKYELKDLYKKKQESIALFYNLYDNNLLIKQLIESVAKRHNIQEDSLIILRELNNLINMSIEWIAYNDLAEQILDADKEIEFLNTNIDNTNITSIADLEKSIMMDNINIIKEKDELKKLENDKEIKKHILNINSIYNKYLASRNKEYEDNIRKLKNEFYRDIISYLRDYKFKIEDSIKKSDIISEKVKMLSSEVNSMENTSRLLRLAIKALCPNEGLIADSILHFMQALVEDMNYIINSIWSYPMEVQPCNLEDGELNYEFPVVSDNRGYTNDISYTSSSMKEIINLSFKMVAMKYSKMENYPLFLDEFGATMDNAHRIKAYQTIDNLALDTFSQVFIVSHYSGVYNRFSDADTIVMDSKNIHLEDNREINKNIKFNTL